MRHDPLGLPPAPFRPARPSAAPPSPPPSVLKPYNLTRAGMDYGHTMVEETQEPANPYWTVICVDL